MTAQRVKIKSRKTL